MNTRVLLFVLAMAAAALGAGTGPTNQVTLAWNPSADSSVAGYFIYVGTESHYYDRRQTVNGWDTTNVVVTGLYPGTHYYFAATAFAWSGLESAYSNEADCITSGDPPVVVTNPPPAAVQNLNVFEVEETK